MASPFAVFRRNQQKLLVVLIVFSIFAFTLSGLFQADGINLTFLGLILGTIVMTIVGVIVDKPARFAAGGALGGLLAGVIASQIFNPTVSDAVADTSIGEISRLEQERVIQDLRLANNFIGLAMQQALGEEGARRAPQFGFGLNGRTIQEEVVLNILMKKEADKLGIVVDKGAVSDYISLATQEKLSKRGYEEVLDALKVSDGQVFRVLSEQIAIKTARGHIGPQSIMTPEKYWDFYQKLQFTQTIQSVSIPVDEFVDEVKTPSEDELQAFFEAHKTNFPGSPNPESIGFRQPRKIQLAYLEASYLDLEATVPEITDQEIEDYYEANKETLYLNKRVPDFDLNMDDGVGGSGSTAPDLFDPNLPSPKVDLDNLGTEAPEPEKKETPTPEQPSTEKPGTPEAPDTEPKTDSDEKPADPEESKDQSSRSLSSNSLQTVAFVQEDEETKSPEKEEKPSEEKPTVAPSEEKQAGNEKPVLPEPKPAEETENVVPPAPSTDLDAPLIADKPEVEPPKYKPLDGILRDQIRDQLLEQRTRAKQQALAEKAEDFMSALAEEHEDLREQYFPDSPDQEKEMKAKLKTARDEFAVAANEKLADFAEENGLNYEVTPLLSQEALSLSNDYPIGSATIGMELSNEEQESVASYQFRLNPTDLFNPKLARSLDPESVYVYWKTFDKPERIPEFDDEGIQEQVLEAWKMLKAKPLAKERADELAKELRKTEKTWSEYLLNATITGDKEGVFVEPPLIETFSWMRTASVPGPMGFPSQVPQMTTLSTVDSAGEKFMYSVFTEIEEGGIGVVPNDDESEYYVVQVRERRPSTQEELTTQREAFLRTDMFRSQIGFENGQIQFPSPYVYLVGGELQELYRKWIDQLLASYDVKFLQVPEDETESF
ncbi:MAG: hypothetical protein HUJ26_13615 [Planctomycetaceae bacterium]|nr:hypothetical protein [Planctomycetaceae bacterium]